MSIDWKTEIAIAWQVQQRNQQLDRAGIWNYSLPHVAATEDSLAQAEAALGCKLDPVFRLFLSCADGWPDFYQAVDLFGTNELVGSQLMDNAIKMLSVVDDAVWQDAGVQAADVSPIAVSKSDRDIFLIVNPSCPSAGQILWLSGALVDRFPNFHEFFLAMVDYNRETRADFERAEQDEQE